MSSSIDGDEAEAIAALGQALLLRLSALLRTARTYDVSNQAFQRQMREFEDLLRRAHEHEDEVALVVVADYLYLNGVRIKAQSAVLGAYHSVVGDFERRQVGGLRFLPGVTGAEIERFFQIFVAAEDASMAERLPDLLHEAAIANVVVVPASDLEADELTRELDDDATPGGERARARKVFWRAVLGTKRVVLRARQQGRPDLRQAKRLVQPIVDNIMKHEYSIVGLTALKDHDEYTYTHCVNVAVLSIAMGQQLELPRQALADLGVAGLLHDLGKMSIPGDVLRKPGALSPDEWGLMHRHPLEGAIMVARMPGLSTVMLDAMRACLEHHMNYNRTGYPEVALPWGQATMSRIVAMSDCFDAITAHRAYHSRPRTAFEGLQVLLGPNRVNFDPAVLWALVRSVGLYPAGTVLQTGSGHVVLVTGPNPHDVTHPRCRVLVRPDGSSPSEDAPELWDPMPADEQALRVLLPEEHKLSTSELLAA
ncbi:MAG TPA: HD domain-containing phosphohydrolase [Candidatus Acidoferrales bacterium]|nr:HD domain-containing phosphohydrolase [Candidatus Acidoferrales bacterium]